MLVGLRVLSVSKSVVEKFFAQQKSYIYKCRKKFEFWISPIRQQIFWNTLWNSQMMESFISDFFSDWKIKKKSKVEAFSLWRENKIIWTPTNNWWWVINESFATKRLFRYVRKWKKSDRTTILIVTNLNYFTFLTYFYTFIRIFKYYNMVPQFSSTKWPPSKNLTHQNPWFWARND